MPPVSFNVTLSSPPAGGIVGGSPGVGTIYPGTVPGPSVSSVSSVSGNEGTSLVHTVTLSAATTASTDYAFTIGGGTAIAGTDYNATPTFTNGVTLLAGTLTVPSGVTSFNIIVAALTDALTEGTEFYSISAGGVFSTGSIQDPGSSLITPTFTQTRSSGVAPLTVTFDASGTTAVAITSRPFHDLRYRWDYGDSAGGAVWTYGSRADLLKNISLGPIGSHCFETPGTKTVTLYVDYIYSNGVVDSAVAFQRTVTVDDPDVVFAGTNTIVFSTSGSFGAKPSGAQEVTISDYGTAISTYKATGKRLLFRKSETFTAATKPDMDVDGPWTIGAYDTGANPIFRGPTGDYALGLSNNNTAGISDGRLMDLDFDGQSSHDRKGISAGGGIDQVTMLRLRIRNVVAGISFSYPGLDAWNSNGNPIYHGHTIWDQLGIFECDLDDMDSSFSHGSDTGAFIAAKHLTIMGCNWNSQLGGGHVLRTPYQERGRISNNYFGRPSSDGSVLKFHAPIQGASGVTAGLYSELVTICDNTFQGADATGVVAIEPQNQTEDERHKNIIFERNYVMAGPGSQLVFQAQGEHENLTVRNNVFNGSAVTAAFPVFMELRDSPTANYYGGGMRVYNNTFYSSAARQFRAISIPPVSALTAGIEVYNNLAYGPGSTSNAFYYDSGSSSISKGNNSSDAQILTNPVFSSIPTTATQLSATDFKPTTGYAIDGGVYSALVFDDRVAAQRTGTNDIGATQP